MTKKDLSEIDRELAVVRAAIDARLRRLSSSSSAKQGDTEQLLLEVEQYLGDGEIETVVAPQRRQPPAALPTWGDLVEESNRLLELEGTLLPSSTADLLTDTELGLLNERLSRPIYTRVEWDEWDFAIVGAAGILGGLIDLLAGTPGSFLQKEMADKSSGLGGWMEEVHQRAPGGAPIDYQGQGFGGGDHRARTWGHDLFRPFEGIRQFHDGVFRGFYFKDGVKYTVETATNQYGTPYASMDWSSAVVAWMIHNACDFFSSRSLPIPGTSWLYESTDRDLRIFVQQDLYGSGLNLRHLSLQALAPLATEIVIRASLAIRNWGQPPSAGRVQKTQEMLCAAHSICLAWNLGKIAVTGNPLLLNVSQALALGRHFVHLALLEFRRTSFFSISLRNADDLAALQAELEDAVKGRPCLRLAIP